MGKAKPVARVISRDMTHELPDQGLTLEGGRITPIPAEHLDHVLTLPGVALVDSPETSPIPSQE